MRGMEVKKHHYSERNIKTVMDVCLKWSTRAKRYTYLALAIGFIISLFNWHDNRHLVWLVLVIIIVTNGYIFRKVNRLNRYKMAGLVATKSGVLQRKYYRGDALVANTEGYIPILGQLFPKIWGKKMEVSPHYYIEVEGDTYIIDEQTYYTLEEGENVELIFTVKYGVFLDVIPLTSDKTEKQ